jgi:AcrR family transcriptional regulator
MLRRGPGHSPELVERNQRERLLAATVVAIAERGYERTPVSELLALSGISRTTFYQHFPGGKEEVLLAAVDAATATATGAVQGACAGEGSWEERFGRGLEALADAIAEQPAAAKLCLVDVHAAGTEGLRHGEEALASFGWLMTQGFGQSPERAGVPPAVVSGIVGGIRKVLETRVIGGEIDALPATMPELERWALSYRTPPVPIRRPRSRPPAEGASRLVLHDQVQRIFGAVATTVAEKGYPAMTLDDIVKNASASLTTFYQHFDGKEEAFLAAYNTALAQATAAAMPPYRWSRSWPGAVRAALEAFLSFFAAEPLWARIAMVDVLTAGPRALEHRDRTIGLFEEILRPGFDEAPDVSPLAPEAIGGAVYALMRAQINRRGAEHLSQVLPAATFVALAPFLGAEEAVAVANKGAGRTRGRGGDGGAGVRGARIPPADAESAAGPPLGRRGPHAV